MDQIKGWGNFIILWTMQGIMIYRVSSMYHHSRKVICTLLACLAVEVAITSTMQALPYRKRSIVLDSPEIVSCVEKVFPRWYRILWVPIILFESLIFAMSIWKGVEYYRESYTVNGAIYSDSGKSLVYTLLRDSILFPFIALIVCYINVIGWGYFSFTTITINVAVSSFMTRILGCRLILNLREAYYQPFGDEFTQANNMDSLVFAQSRGDEMDQIYRA
ncbi:hypothetical protein B0H34DRAFT_721934 [Crassisporium funariophilum]|nr:hypothetical protein B0H34DRAFT_721934 [Crassisporium funariophilum]